MASPALPIAVAVEGSPTGKSIQLYFGEFVLLYAGSTLVPPTSTQGNLLPVLQACNQPFTRF